MHILAPLALVLLIALPGDAAALVLCRKHAAVAARESCRPKETPLSLVGLGEPGEPGTPGAQGPAGEAPLHLVDAAGSEVGPLVAVENFLPFVPDPSFPLDAAVVSRPPLTNGALLGVGLTGAPVGSVRYVSADCTGQPLLPPGGLIAELQVIGDTVFAPSEASSPTSTGSVETNDASLGCESTTSRGGCCRAQASSGPFAPANAVTTLSALGIVPPMHAVLR
jgi:hypothetical protein